MWLALRHLRIHIRGYASYDWICGTSEYAGYSGDVTLVANTFYPACALRILTCIIPPKKNGEPDAVYKDVTFRVIQYGYASSAYWNSFNPKADGQVDPMGDEINDSNKVIWAD